MAAVNSVYDQTHVEKEIVWAELERNDKVQHKVKARVSSIASFLHYFSLDAVICVTEKVMDLLGAF